MTDRIRIRRTATVGKVPTTLDLQEGELGLNTIDKKLYSSDGTSVFEIGNTIKSYSNLNTDITSLISGTTSGNLFEGITSGHFVIGIKSDDAQDGFHILDKGNATSSNTDPYLNRLFSVSRSLGVSTTLPVSAPSFFGNGALLTNLNASNISTGTVNVAQIPTGTTGTTVALGNHNHAYLPLTGGTITENLTVNGSITVTNLTVNGSITGSSGAGVSLLEWSPLGSTFGDFRVLSSKTGLTGNIITERTWLRRKANGTDWQTASFHNGITVDVSFDIPRSTTRTWWERDISAGTQSWGDQATTFFSVGSSTFNIPLTTQSTSTTTGALIVGGGVGVSGAIFANTVSANSYNLIPVGRGVGGVSSNTVVGVDSLQANTTGNNCSAFGVASLQANTTGNNCSAFGVASLRANTTGNNCSAFGVNAGRFQSDGVTEISVTNNSCFIGTSTKGTQNATNENVFGYNATGNGSNTVTIGDNNIINTYLKGIVNTDLLISSKGIKIGGSFYPSYEANIDFLNDPANTWRRLVSVVCPSITFSTIGFCIEIIDPMGNHAMTNTVHTIKKETYYVACVRTESTTFDSPDACYVTGPSDRIRAVKTSIGNYEVQIQSDNTNREYRLSICVYASNGNHTVNYYAGDTASVGIAQYNASVSTTASENFQNVSILNSLIVTGNIGLGITTPATKLESAGIIRVNSNTQFTGFAVSNGAYTIAQLQGSSITNDNGVLTLRDTGVPKVQIISNGISYLNGGNVGIGTTTPTETLHVIGNILATGVITATSFSGSGTSITSLNASNLSSGTVPTVRLGSGTANTTTFLRGDNTWQTINTGSTTLAGLTDTTITTPTSGNFLRHNGTAWVNTALVAGDIPNLDAGKITTGTLDIARIPTGTTGTTVALGNHNHDSAYLPLTGGGLTGNLTVANQGELRLSELTANGTNYVALRSPGTLAANITLTLPTALGTNGQVLSTDASGNLSWANNSADNLGNHTATTTLNMNGQVINAASAFYLSNNHFSITNNAGGTNISLGTTANSEYGVSSIEMPTHITYGGTNNDHTGVKLASGGMSGWGTAQFQVYTSTDWKTYSAIPCFRVTNNIATVSSGILNGLSSTFGSSSIELGYNSTISFIDFHSNSTSAATDFEARIACTGYTGGARGGDLGIQATNLTLTAAVTNINSDCRVSNNLSFQSVNGVGIRWFNDDRFKLYTSYSTDATFGGRLDTTSDWNMYFKVTLGTNRGFVFMNSTTPVAQIDGGGRLYIAGSISTINNITPQNGAISLSPNLHLNSGNGLASNVNNAVIINWSNVTPTNTSQPTLLVGNGAAAELIRVNYNGNVGIGTASPGAKLTVSGGEGTYNAPNFGSTNLGAINILNTTSNRRNGITFSAAGVSNAQAGIYVHQDNGSGTTMYLATTDSYLTGPQTRLTILNNGNVGIGTSGPSQKLDVAGNINLSGALIMNGATIIDSGGGWHRTYGATGWYNSTYEGGMYMIDTTWVRTYNGKSLYSQGNLGVAGAITVINGISPTNGAIRMTGNLHLNASSENGIYINWDSGGSVATSKMLVVGNGSSGEVMYVRRDGLTASNIFHTNKLEIAGDTLNRFELGRLVIRGSSPTLYFRDYDHASAMIHCNANVLYFLRGGVDTESWSGVYPLTLNLSDGAATFGGAVSIQGTVGIGGTINAPLYRTNGTTNGAVGIASSACVNTNAQMELTVPSYSNNTVHISFHKPGVFASNFGLDSDNQFACGGWSSGNGYAGFKAGHITAFGNFVNNGGYVYPGRADAGGAYQGNWFLGSHASYGLYTNTGFYASSHIYTSGAIQMINGITPPKGAIRLTPNIHLNAGAGYAMYVNWDNGAGSGGNPSFIVADGGARTLFSVNYNGYLSTVGTIRFSGGGGVPTEANCGVITWNSISSGAGTVEFVDYCGSGGATCFAFYRVPNIGTPAAGNIIASINQAGTYTVLSDERVKKDIKDIEYGLNTVLALRPRKYNHYVNNKFEDGKVENGDIFVSKIGLVAQEVYPIVPEIVEKPENEKEGFYSLDYTSLIPVLIKAIQEQQNQIDILQTTVSILMKKLHDIII